MEKYDINDRELATILCALRTHQEQMETIGYNAISTGIWFDEVTALNVEEIDELCAKLNMKEISTLTITVRGESKLDLLESIKGYAKILSQTDPTITITTKYEE